MTLARAAFWLGVLPLVGCSSLCSGSCGDEARKDSRGTRVGDQVSSGAERAASPQRAAAVRDHHPSPIGTNMGGYLSAGSPEIAFVDIFRMSSGWKVMRSDWTPVEGDFDADGWVKSLPPGHFALTRMMIDVPGQYPSGRYVCLYDGEGKLEFDGAATVVSRSPGRIELEVDASKNGLNLSLTQTNPEDHVRNVRVIMPGHEKTYREKPWNPRFLTLLRPFNTLRFVHWIRTNETEDHELHWSERPTPTFHTQASTKGVSVEVMVDLANTVGANAYFNLPHGATDEYIREFATVVRDRLDPKRLAYFEWDNETWNGGFASHWWAAEQGCKLGFNRVPPNTGGCDGGPKFFAAVKYHAMRSGQMFEILDEVFGPEGRHVKVLASMSFPSHSRDLIAAFDDPRINKSRSRPDALAIAPYFGGQLGGENADHEGEPMYPGLPRDIGRWSVDQVIDVCRKIVDEMEKSLREHAELAREHGMFLIAYEGGQHLDAVNAGWDSDQQRLFLKANADPRMGEIYRDYFSAWRRVGGRLFNHFKLIEGFKGGSFGLVERLDQDPRSSPRFAAILDFIEQNPRWW